MQSSADAIVAVIEAFGRKGVRFWQENGQLRYEAPRGALTSQDLERLRANKANIIAHLSSRSEPAEPEDPALGPRRCSNSAPLTFSQLVRWRLLQKGEVPNVRSIASALRLCGSLNVAVLQASLNEIVRRHEALRTQVVIRDGLPVQEIAAVQACTLELEDLSLRAEEAGGNQLEHSVQQFILTPLDVSRDPLFAARLIKVRPDEHVLVLAMEHIISDAASGGILLRDVLAAYAQLLENGIVSLAPIAIQFADYACWQSRSPAIRARKNAYWNARLAGSSRLRFPDSEPPAAASCSGWGRVPVTISREKKAQLQSWSRSHATTQVMALLTCFAAALARWCQVTDAVIQYQSDGRVRPEVSNSIGYFACPLYLRLQLTPQDTLVALMQRLTQEFCNAHEHSDESSIATQEPRPAFTRNPAFNWVPRGSGPAVSQLPGSPRPLVCSPVEIAHPTLDKLELDHEPILLLYDGDEQVSGGVFFPKNHLSEASIRNFAQAFAVITDALLEQPTVRIRDIPISSASSVISTAPPDVSS